MNHFAGKCWYALLIIISVQLYVGVMGQLQAQNFAPNQLLVQFGDYALLSEQLKLQEEVAATPLNYYPLLNAQLWQLPTSVQVPDGTVLTGVIEIRDYCVAKGYVQEADPNFEYELLVATPNDPQFSQCWGLNNTGQSGGTVDADVDAPEAWNIRTDGSGKVVGITDTGIDYTHPDLQTNMWINSGEIPNNGMDDDNNGYIDDYYGYDFGDNDGDPMDTHGHGTHVAGTIGAVGNNSIGVAGVAWTAKIAAIKVFPDGAGFTSASTIIEGIQYAVDMNIPITNNSYGSLGYSNIMYNIIQDAETNGQLFVAAAGNYNFDNDIVPYYPASYNLDNIISVAATDRNDNMASFSHYGVNSVDLGAPGVSILSTTPNNSYASYNGTSMASPHVAGVAALVWSANPSMTAADVKERILCTVDEIPALSGKCVSEGRLNAFKALQPPSPDATFTYTINGLSVDFVANNLDPNVLGYDWDFGDGSTTNNATVLHTYVNGGTYNVCLTVVDDCGSGTYCEDVILSGGVSCGTGTWQQYLNGYFITSILETNNGDIFAGTDSGLAKINLLTGQITFFTASNSDLPWNVPFSLLEGSDGSIYVGTSAGLAKFDGINSTGWTIFTTSNSDLPGNDIRSLLEGSDGSVYVGTVGGGLAKFDGVNPIGWMIFNTSNSDLPGDNIHSLLEGSDGNIYVGTSGGTGGLAKFDGNSPTGWTVFNTSNSDLSWNKVTSLLEGSDGSIYVGTFGGGLAKFDGVNPIGWMIFNTSNSDLPGNEVVSLLERSDGNIYIGTFGGGVAKFDGSSNTGWTIFNTSNSDLLQNQVLSILESSNNEIFIGTSGGLSILSNTIVASFTSPPSTCINTSLTFTNTSVGATNYVWQIGGNPVATTTDLTHTFTTIGTYTVTLIASDASGTCTDTYSETITIGSNANTLNLGPDIVECNNTSVVLDAGTTDMQLYAWDYNGTYVGGTPTITVTQSGTYTLVVWDPCNNTGFDDINVSFATPNAVNLGPDITTCNPSQTLDAGTGYSSYLWSTGQTTQTITVTSTNIYSVTVTDANGCTDTDDIIVIFAMPPVVNLGPDILDCVSSIVLDAGISAPGMTYLWSNGLTTQAITATTSGTYSVTVTDANGCTASDNIQVYLDNDCVWPGDANYDDVVNNFDILNIALGIGTMDVSRPNATINWQAEPCPDWANNFSNGVNYKHADCDGNNLIDIADTLAVVNNYGQTHNGNAPRYPSNPATNLELVPMLNNCNTNNSQNYSYDIEVHLDDLSGGNIPLHGIAFTFEYPIGMTVTADFSDTSLDDDGASLITLAQHFPAQGKIEVAISRINQVDIPSVGRAAKFNVTQPSVPANNPQTVQFATSNVLGKVASGADVLINGQQQSNSLPFASPFSLNPTLFTCNGTATLDAGISAPGMTYLWSNGLTTQTINVTTSGIYSVTVTNAAGCSAVDQIDAYLDNDCVWPGDTDYNGMVNSMDIYPLGLNVSSTATGPARPNATTNWQKEPCRDWGNCLAANYPQYATLDCKHLDTNGDGTVDIAIDAPVAQAHMNLTHNYNNRTPNSNIIIRPDIVTYPTAANGNLLEIDLYLHENNLPVDLYGAAFTIDYSTEFANAQIDFSNSWLGTLGTDLFKVDKDFSTQGMMMVGMVRNDLNNVTGLGPIARFTATAVNTANVTVAIDVSSSTSIDNTATINYLSDETSDPIPLYANPPTTVQLKAFLEGAYTTNATMHTALNSQGLLPNTQPFSAAPWNYTGNESVANFANNVVDWILVEARDANNNYVVLESRAALLLDDGRIVDVDGITNGVNFFALAANTNYYLTLRHRNHLDVMSATAVNLSQTTVFDFSVANYIMGGTGQVVEIEPNVYALSAGDFDANGVVNVADYNDYKDNVSLSGFYMNCDSSMDGNILVDDFNYYQPNAARIGIPQIRY